MQGPGFRPVFTPPGQLGGLGPRGKRGPLVPCPCQAPRPVAPSPGAWELRPPVPAVRTSPLWEVRALPPSSAGAGGECPHARGLQAGSGQMAPVLGRITPPFMSTQSLRM